LFFILMFCVLSHSFFLHSRSQESVRGCGRRLDMWPNQHERPTVWPSLWCVTQYNEQVWWRAKQADNEVLISVAFNTLRPLVQFEYEFREMIPQVGRKQQ
jgi:hypothetical protein